MQDSDPDSGVRVLSVERSTSTAHRLLHYDGACGRIHGHNFEWDVELMVSMEDEGERNMPVDLKAVAERIDYLDHEICLNAEDPMTEHIPDAISFSTGDPTCEVVAKWMAQRLYDISPAVKRVELTVHETEKYGVEATYP